jgi:hypothetical protein
MLSWHDVYVYDSLVQRIAHGYIDDSRWIENFRMDKFIVVEICFKLQDSIVKKNTK